MHNLLYRRLLALALTAGLAACSDDSDNNGNGNGNGGEVEPPLVSIETPNADRCEILDANNCMFPWPSSAFTVAD